MTELLKEFKNIKCYYSIDNPRIKAEPQKIFKNIKCYYSIKKYSISLYFLIYLKTSNVTILSTKNVRR